MKGISDLDEFQNAPEKENLMLVDCLNLAFRYKHRGQTDFAGDYLRTVSSLARSYGAKTVILLSDFGKSAFRLNIREEYKDRSAMYENQTEEEKQAFVEFLEGFERALEIGSATYPLLKFRGVEADDLAAYIVKHYSDRYKHTWLISSDQDWDLLLSDKVSRFSFVTRKEYKVDDFYDHKGCDNPSQYVCVKALMGDSGDNIVGVANVGIKRAYNFLRQYGTAMDLLDALPLPENRQINKNLNNSVELIMDNLVLVDLLSYCEDAIAFPDPTNLDKIKELCEEITS